MKARRVQLVRCNVQAPVRAAVTAESAHHTSDVKGVETKLIQHGGKRTFGPEPCTLVGVAADGRVVAGKLLYKNLYRWLSVSLAVVAEGKQKGMGKS